MLIGGSSRFWLTIIAGTFAITAAAAEQLRGPGGATQVNPQPLPPAPAVAVGKKPTGPSENLSLNYDKINPQYQQQKPAGGKARHKNIQINKYTDKASPQ